MLDSTQTRKDLSGRALILFLFLQALDVITTLIGFRMGAHEGSFFICRLIQLGPVTGLLLAKALGLIAIIAVFALERTRLIVFLNFWFAGVVTWNLVIIFLQAWTRR